MELTIKVKFGRLFFSTPVLSTAVMLESGYDTHGDFFSEEADMTKAKELTCLIKETIDKYEKHLQEEYEKEKPQINWEKLDRKICLISRLFNKSYNRNDNSGKRKDESD